MEMERCSVVVNTEVEIPSTASVISTFYFTSLVARFTPVNAGPDDKAKL